MVNADPPCTTVYYDGACPVCSREIAMYRRRDRAGAVRWIDASNAAPAVLGGDLSREAALERLHVRDAQGRLVSGAAAFVTLWQALPATAWWGRLCARPFAVATLEVAYRGFLRLRRLWRAPGPVVR